MSPAAAPVLGTEFEAGGAAGGGGGTGDAGPGGGGTWANAVPLTISANIPDTLLKMTWGCFFMDAFAEKPIVDLEQI
jgi:hypothetical protein